jgi:outer membrane protein assembly factor BamB
MKTSYFFCVLWTTCALAADPEVEWPQFHGPNASGVAAEAKPPFEFGADKNVLWKSPAPSGVSSIIVWEDRLFLTGFASNHLVTVGYDARQGRELWRRVAPAEKIESSHEFSSPAASTPCTDGKRVYTYFNSFGIIAHDFSGNEVWRRPLPMLPVQYGSASSPILVGDRLIVQRDGGSTNSHLLALDPATGKTLWDAARPLARDSHSTPMVWHHDGVAELMVQGKGRLTAYDPVTGTSAWWVSGWGFIAMTTPVAGDGLLFAGSSGIGDPSEPDPPVLNWAKLVAEYDANKDGALSLEEIPASLGWQIRPEIPKETPGNYLPIRDLMRWFVDTNKDGLATKAEWDAMDAFSKDKLNADRFVAIRPGGHDNATDTHVVWETTRGLAEMASPLFYRGRVYIIRDGGLLTIFEPKSGQRVVDRERIGASGQYVASPVAANGLVYFVNESGTVTVLRAGDKVDVVCVNKLGESVRSTPAIVGNKLFVRTRDHVWAFGQ